MIPSKDNVFGTWLSAAMEESRMSAGDLYQRALISRAAVYHYINGTRVPDEACAGRIASALGIPIEQVPVYERKKPGRPSVRKLDSPDEVQQVG